MYNSCYTLSKAESKLLLFLQIAAFEEDIDRFQASRAAAQAEAEEADAAAQQALETGHAEVSTDTLHLPNHPCLHPYSCPCPHASAGWVAVVSAARSAKECSCTLFYTFTAWLLQVMKLRRRFDELASEVSNLGQQREFLLAQMSEDKAEWEKLHKVCGVNLA